MLETWIGTKYSGEKRNEPYIVTVGAGFIGSAVVRHIINDTRDAVCAVDKLTCAGNPENLAPVTKSNRFKFEKVDICDRDELDRVFAEFKLTHVMHLTAEILMDRSIDGPGELRVHSDEHRRHVHTVSTGS